MYPSLILPCFDVVENILFNYFFLLFIEIIGFPESDIKKFFDPKNEVTYNVVEKNGVFEVISTVSMLPEWNSNIVAKVDK